MASSESDHYCTLVFPDSPTSTAPVILNEPSTSRSAGGIIYATVMCPLRGATPPPLPPRRTVATAAVHTPPQAPHTLQPTQRRSDTPRPAPLPQPSAIRLDHPRPTSARAKNDYVDASAVSPSKTLASLSAAVEQQKATAASLSAKVVVDRRRSHCKHCRCYRPRRRRSVEDDKVPSSEIERWLQTNPTKPETVRGRSLVDDLPTRLPSATRAECEHRTKCTIICRRCGRCRCAACTTPQHLPERWVCAEAPGGGCLLSADSIVEALSGVKCVRACAQSDAPSGEESGGCRRWACLAAAAFCLPCLCLYWPMRACAAGVNECYVRANTRGCRCPDRPTDATVSERASTKGSRPPSKFELDSKGGK